MNSQNELQAILESQKRKYAPFAFCSPNLYLFILFNLFSRETNVALHSKAGTEHKRVLEVKKQIVREEYWTFSVGGLTTNSLDAHVALRALVGIDNCRCRIIDLIVNLSFKAFIFLRFHGLYCFGFFCALNGTPEWRVPLTYCLRSFSVGNQFDLIN